MGLVPLPSLIMGILLKFILSSTPGLWLPDVEIVWPEAAEAGIQRRHPGGRPGVLFKTSIHFKIIY